MMYFSKKKCYVSLSIEPHLLLITLTEKDIVRLENKISNSEDSINTLKNELDKAEKRMQLQAEENLQKFAIISKYIILFSS